MRRNWLLGLGFVASLAVAAGACSKAREGDNRKSASGGEATASSGKATPAARPPLTRAELLGTEGLVKTGDSFDAARAKLEGVLGKSIYAEKVHQWWAVIDGDSCFGTTIEAGDGDLVGEYMAPRELKAGDGNKYRQCVAAAARNACYRRGEADCINKHATAPFAEDEAMAGIEIAGCEPNMGPAAGGTEITVQGTGLKAALDRGAKVLFGDREVEAIAPGDEGFKIKAPAAKPGDYVDIVLVLPAGHRETIGSFAYVE